ncbi:hypothetical protein OB920_05630 [Halobacteria archaeon HArc-gm2]|nr:hypothetical protein [Halobacteria archaeon HArc-gm2]
MASLRSLEWGVVGVILLTLVASSAGLGSDGVATVTTAGTTSAVVGDGTAEVSVVSLPSERLRIDDGRFGTGVQYLRIPDIRIRVNGVDGDPRLVYRVEVPALDVDEAATKSLTNRDGQTVTVRGVDQAFDPDDVAADRYDARVTVRVQSFEVDETVVSVNESVAVGR